MKERHELADGTFTFANSAPAGTRVEVPLKVAPADADLLYVAVFNPSQVTQLICEVVQTWRDSGGTVRDALVSGPSSSTEFNVSNHGAALQPEAQVFVVDAALLDEGGAVVVRTVTVLGGGDGFTGQLSAWAA